MHRTVLIIMLAAALAGCTDADTPGAVGETDAQQVATPGLSSTAPANATAHWEMDDCIQFHTTFPARAEDFPLPHGYAAVSDDAGMVALRVTPTACADAATFIVSIPVTVPAGMRLEGHSHQFVLEAYADESTVAWLATQGVDARTCGCHVDFFTAAAPVFHADAAGHSYTMRLALAPSSGAFGAEATAYFSGDPPVRWTAAAGEALNLGIGEVALSYEGEGGAPPALLGNIAHAVTSMAMTLEVA